MDPEQFAMKSGRNFIGVELGGQAVTHCIPRLKKVIYGNDALPLSEELGWKGGGGFKFYELAPSLLRKDKYGNWVIDEKNIMPICWPRLCASMKDLGSFRMRKYIGNKASPQNRIISL
ncbi:MAG: hypothetical protein HY920_01620 [Elusimicrobia bacterium]|nr:hypothetical protein [Elusimicrobiota bacterium]